MCAKRDICLFANKKTEEPRPQWCPFNTINEDIVNQRYEERLMDFDDIEYDPKDLYVEIIQEMKGD